MTTWTCPPQIGARRATVSVWTLVLPSKATSAAVELSYETILDPESPKTGGLITHLEVDPGGTARHVLATTLSGEKLTRPGPEDVARFRPFSILSNVTSKGNP